jgi:hypothetical protein
MNSILTYIESYADVRALLGVSSDELEDEVISVSVFVRVLEQDLKALDFGLHSTYLEAAVKLPQSRSAAEVGLFEAVQTYATFHVAEQLCTSLPQFSPKTISDGKAFAQRHADAPYKVTMDGVAKGKALALENLKRIYGDLYGSSYAARVAFSGMRISTPTSDPVTGS